MRNTNYTALLLVGCMALVGCAGLNRNKVSALGVTPNSLQTSYDYTKPGDIDRQDKPVFILPQVTGGWKKAQVDGDEWHSGQYVAKVIEPGHWATLEEAELSGKPYIIPGQGNKPIVPTPVQDQSPTRTGEYSVTGIEQKLARLEALGKNTSASATSVENQAAIPQEASMVDTGGPKGNQPPLDIPGLQSPHPAPIEPTPKPTPFSLAVQPPNEIPKAPTPQRIAPMSPSTPNAPPLSLPGTKEPLATFDAKSKTVVIGYGEPGEIYTVKTPMGDVSVAYKDGGKVDVTYGGKTVTASSPTQSGSVKVDLSSN